MIKWQQIHIYKQLNLKKTNKQVEQKQTHRYREHFDGYWRARGLWSWVKKAEGLREYSSEYSR